MIPGSISIMDVSICRAINGAVPITRGTKAACIPMVVPQIKRVTTATVGTKMINGMERNKLMILSKIQKTTLFSRIPPFRVTTTITPRNKPRMVEMTPLMINIYKVSAMALGNSSAYVMTLENHASIFFHLHFYATFLKIFKSFFNIFTISCKDGFNLTNWAIMYNLYIGK